MNNRGKAQGLQSNYARRMHENIKRGLKEDPQAEGETLDEAKN